MGGLLAIAGGAAALLSLTLPFFQGSVGGGSRTAFQVLDGGDIVLSALAIATVVLGIVSLVSRARVVPLALTAVAWLTCAELLQFPTSSVGALEWGGYLGAGGSLVAAAGAVLVLAEALWPRTGERR